MLDKIKRRINEKGWNLYQVDDPRDPAYTDAIEHGPADILSRGAHYILIPQVDNPRSPKAVDEATLYLMEKNIYPTIRQENDTVPIGSIKFSDERTMLRIYGGDLMLMSHEEFYHRIDDLPRP